jgi:hypothetical protein
LCKFCHLHFELVQGIWKIHIVASSSSMTIPCGPYFLDFVIPFKLSEKNVRGMCQCLQDFFKEVYSLSTTSIASSKDSIVHLLHCCKIKNCSTLMPCLYCMCRHGILLIWCWLDIPLHHL